MAKKKDKYDRAIEYLRKHPDQIESAWAYGGNIRAHCLFKYVTPTGRPGVCKDGVRSCGCLTTIKSDDFVAFTPQLTKLILKDRRIPNNIDRVGVSDLPVFAEWQRRIDKELNRK